ncbi:MAG: tetratricopeptide repeat protein [Promethearchaeota archaeon]
MKISEERGDIISTFLGNIGSIFEAKEEFDKALKYHKRALDYCERVGDLNGKAFYLNAAGKILTIKGDFDQALKYFQEATNIAEQLSSPDLKEYNMNAVIARTKKLQSKN